jgi:NodT family efflux transporter outer membrane factor (OMF) lipoprotein
MDARPRISRLAALALPLVLAACAVGPDYAPPEVALSAKWSNDGRRTAPPERLATLGEWWKGFGDPLLDRLIEEAVAGNLDVAVAQAKVREARATRREAIGGLLPQVDGAGSAKRVKTAGTGGSATSQFQAGLDASWELDLFGGNARAVEAATRGTEAAEDDLHATLLTLVGDVATNYAEARGLQARIDLARRTAASQRRTADLTRSRFQAGSASAVDGAKADAQAASTEATIPDLRASYAQAVHRLSVLTGREPGALAASMAPVKPIPALRHALPTGIPADVLHLRPDVRAAERRLAQATASVGKAEAALYPSVSLTGQVSTTGVRLGDLGRASTVAWSWGPSVSVPIFQGGRLVAARDAAEAERDQSLAAWKSAVLTALEDVENALVGLAQERIKGHKLAEATARYRQAAELSRTLYVNGSASFLDVLDAERSLFSAEDSLLQSRIAVATDHVALAKALGGGWTRPVEVAKRETADAPPDLVGWRGVSVSDE